MPGRSTPVARLLAGTNGRLLGACTIQSAACGKVFTKRQHNPMQQAIAQGLKELLQTPQPRLN
jgi:hypothetical protein